MIEQLNINIDELTKLFFNIIKNDTFSIENNVILNEIISNYDEIKQENIKLNNELEEYKLTLSSLKECIEPADNNLNLYVKKYSLLKDKYNKISNYSNKLLNENNKLIIEHNKFIKQIKQINKKREDNKKEYKKILFDTEINIKNIKKENNQLKQDNINKELQIKLLETIDDEKNKTIEILTKENKKLQDEIIKLNEKNNDDNNIITQTYSKILQDNKNIFLNDKIIFEDDKELSSNILKSVVIDEKQNIIISNSDDSKNYIDVSKIKNIFTDEYFEDDIKEDIKEDIIEDKTIKINNHNIDIFDKHFINKRTEKRNNEFFKEELNKPIKNNTGEIKNNYNNITYSTDYMVNYLKNDDKIKQNKNIFIETIREDEEENEILKAPNIIKPAPNIIKPAPNIIKPSPKQNLKGGNNKNNKMNVEIIDNVKKMVIGGELTTLTEQDINIDDKKKVHLIYNKKNKRYNREQEKQKLLNEIM